MSQRSCADHHVCCARTQVHCPKNWLTAVSHGHQIPRPLEASTQSSAVHGADRTSGFRITAHGHNRRSSCVCGHAARLRSNAATQQQRSAQLLCSTPSSCQPLPDHGWGPLPPHASRRMPPGALPQRYGSSPRYRSKPSAAVHPGLGAGHYKRRTRV